MLHIVSYLARAGFFFFQDLHLMFVESVPLLDVYIHMCSGFFLVSLFPLVTLHDPSTICFK